MRCNVLAITLGLVLLITPAALAANPPETINQQDVLRDSDGIPLSGGYRVLRDALQQAHRNRTAAARLQGIDRRTLCAKLRPGT